METTLQIIKFQKVPRKVWRAEGMIIHSHEKFPDKTSFILWHEIDKSEEKTNSLQQLFILIVGFSSFIVCKFHIFMKEIEFNLDNLYDYRISASSLFCI